MQLEILCEVLAFFDRQTLEELAMTSKLFHTIITKYFPITPYRLLSTLNIQTNSWDNLTIVGISCSTYSYPDAGRRSGSFSKIFPYLNAKCIRVELTRISFSFSSIVNSLKNLVDQLHHLKHLWQGNSVYFGMHAYWLGISDEVLKHFFSEPKNLLACDNLELNLKTDTKFRLQAHPLLRNCKRLTITKATRVFASDLAEYLHSRKTFCCVHLNLRDNMFGKPLARWKEFDFELFAKLLLEEFWRKKEFSSFKVAFVVPEEKVEEINSFCLHNFSKKQTLQLVKMEDVFRHIYSFSIKRANF